jgi:hypothetical protein
VVLCWAEDGGWGNAMGCGFHVCAAWVRISTAINAQEAEPDLVRWHGTVAGSRE